MILVILMIIALTSVVEIAYAYDYPRLVRSSEPRSLAIAVDMKGIWVWGSTIRGHEQEFWNWVKQHNFSDIFVLIKGVTGGVCNPKYDVLNALLTLKHSENLNVRIWAWVVGFEDLEATDDDGYCDYDDEWPFGDSDKWVRPDDQSYVEALINVILNAIDPERGYVNYVPDGVVLDDSFRFPGHYFTTKYQVETIYNVTAKIVQAVEQVEQKYGVEIPVVFASMPETDACPDDGTWSDTSCNAYYYGQDVGYLAKVVDMIFPETYTSVYGKPSSWVAEVVNDIKADIQNDAPDRASMVKVYPVLILYYSDDNPSPRPASDLQSDIDYALQASSGFSVFRYASANSNPGAGSDTYDLPTSDQLTVLDQYVPSTGTVTTTTTTTATTTTPSTGSQDPWNRTEFGDNRDIAIAHQQPVGTGYSSYGNDPDVSTYKGWCGIASLYMILHSFVPDLPARLKAKYPSWTDPEFGRDFPEADPYIYHYLSTYAIERLLLYIGGLEDRGEGGYAWSEITQIIDNLNNLGIGVQFEYQYVPLAQMREYLQKGWMAHMNVLTGHYVVVVAYTYDDPNDSTKRYYWILDPWPSSYIGPGNRWDTNVEDPDGDGLPEFNVTLTWIWRKIIWSRQPKGTAVYGSYLMAYVMTGHGVNEVYRDQRGDGTVLMIHLVTNEDANKYVVVILPQTPPDTDAERMCIVRLLKMINGYIYSGVPAVMLLENVTLTITDPETGQSTVATIPAGSVILKGVSPYYARKAAEAAFSDTYGGSYVAYHVYEVNPFSSDQNYRVLKMYRIRLMVYTGTGTIYDTILQRIKWFRFNFETFADANASTMTSRLLDSSFRYRLVFMPGGSATEIANTLGSGNLTRIAQFVANGGAYVGICAGSYLPVKGYNDATSMLEIVNATVAYLNPGEGIVTIEINASHPVTWGFKGQIQMAYYNGPPLVLGGLASDTLGIGAPYPSGLAKFVDGPNAVLIDKVAMLATTYGKGRVVLFSPHPEHDYYSTPGDLPLGAYLWRFMWNAIWWSTGEEAEVVVVPPPVPEPSQYVLLVVIAVVMLFVGLYIVRKRI